MPGSLSNFSQIKMRVSKLIVHFILSNTIYSVGHYAFPSELKRIVTFSTMTSSGKVIIKTISSVGNDRYFPDLTIISFYYFFFSCPFHGVSTTE